MTTEKISRHLLHPELLETIEAMPEMTLTRETLAEVRAGYPALAEHYWSSVPYDLTGLDLSEHRIPGAKGDPDVRILVLQPVERTGPRPAILDIHGGGHVIGDADGNVRVNLALARELGAVVVLVDYRLAPETVYPGSLHDCHAALEWLVANIETYAIDPARIAIAGGSAGGTLAAGLALLNRDRANVPICHLHLINPMLDDRANTNATPYAGEYGWNREANAFGWSALLGVPAGSDGVSPYAAPGRMEDLSGMPPTFISCGTLDLFVEEGIDFARRLIVGGVPVELHIYPGAPHGLTMGVAGDLKDQIDHDDFAAWKVALRAPAA